MWRGKRLVQVHVEHIKSHITWLHFAQNRIQVGTIVVEQSTRIMHGRRNLLDLTLENTAGRRVCHHQACRLRANSRLQRCQVNIAAVGNCNLTHLVTTHDGSRRVGAMRGIWHQNLRPRCITAFVMVSANHCNAGKLTLSTSHWSQ